jgi:hypothetical protein
MNSTNSLEGLAGAKWSHDALLPNLAAAFEWVNTGSKKLRQPEVHRPSCSTFFLGEATLQ